MDSQGLVSIGLYGTRFVLQVGGTELFLVKRVDLQRSFIRLQRWPSEYGPACDFKAFDKPWFHPEQYGIIRRNGCLAKIRGEFTREQLVKQFTNNLTISGIVGHTPVLTEGFGRPAYIMAEGTAFILSGDKYLPIPTSIKRNYSLDLEVIHLSKFGYIIYPSIPELLTLLAKHAGVLCDPFAIQINKKDRRGNQFVHVPLQ